MRRLHEVLGAVYRREAAAIARLGADEANLPDEDGRTPLMHAVLAEDADPAVIRLLLERGADARAHDRLEGWTPLHFASRAQRADLVETLLDGGCPVDVADRLGNTPLWRCVAEPRPDPGTIGALILHGADPDRRNSAGVSPRDLVMRRGLPEILRAFEPRA